MIVGGYSFPQGRLALYPDNIEFKDHFNRLKNVYFVNDGPDTLSIDSISYKNYNLYFLRFDKPSNFPFKIPPYDSIKMDCILTNYFFIPSSDTVDTMFIYNDGQKLIEQLKIKIDYFDETIQYGTINGYVRENGNPIANASVYFLYKGNYIVQSIKTNSSGFFSLNVKPGIYFIAAKKDSFYVTFYDQRFDPLSAKKIKVLEDSTETININLVRMKNTGFSVSGKILDYVSSKTLSKGMIVARRGRHTPSKINSALIDSIPNESYTTIVNYDGSYTLENIIDPNYYLIQSFSDYYLPTYYSPESSIFWQEADSINVNSVLSNINIFMPRDSSIGGGSISGIVSIDGGTPDNVLILAQSVSDNFFNYTTTIEDGSFTIFDLPFGTYKLIGQKIGFNNAESSIIEIDSSNAHVNNIMISFLIASSEEGPQIPKTAELYQNYPNPFNPSTTIEYFIPQSGFVSLKIYDVLGKEIKTLVNEQKVRGEYKINFDGRGLSSGIYFYRLISGNFNQTRKMLIVK